MAIILLGLLFHFTYLGIANKAESVISRSGYRTVNYFRVGPLTERLKRQELGWSFEWTQDQYCQPGTFITGYRLRHNKVNKDAGLESILAVCSNLNNRGGQEISEANILNVQVCHDGTQDRSESSPLSILKEIRSSLIFPTASNHSTSYANGFISLLRETTDSNSDHVVQAQCGFSFQHQPLQTSIDVIKAQDGGCKWGNQTIQKVFVSRCTQGFALCGISAEVARPPSAASHSNQDGEHFTRHIHAQPWQRSVPIKIVFSTLSATHIHRLLFHCCYTCSPKGTWIRVATASMEHTKYGNGSVRTHVPVRIGIEFRPEILTKPEAIRNHGRVHGASSSSWAESTIDSRPAVTTSPSPRPPNPLSINFSYSRFGAKLVVPLVKTPQVEYDTTVEGKVVGDGIAAAAAIHSEHHRGALSNHSALREALGGEYNYFHCFDDKELRKKGAQNAEFTPRIRWSQSYWSTVWQGAMVRLHYN